MIFLKDPDSLWPHYLVHGLLQARTQEWVAFPFSRGSSHPGIKPMSPPLQADSLPAEPQGKPKNTGVGSLSLLQWNFLTQELNQNLLHCRQILYQLSCEGNPLYGTGRVYVINTGLERWACVDMNYKDKEGSERNPGNSYLLLLHDLTNVGTSVKVPMCLLWVEFPRKASEKDRASLLVLK